MNDYTFTLFQNLLQQRSGLYFTDKTRVDLEAGLQRAMQQVGIHDIYQFYNTIGTTPIDDPIWKQLIGYLTIGETYFFRDRTQLSVLKEHILPPIIQERRDKRLRILRLWSAGCSTGEEPYSLVMMLHELIDDIDDWHILIRATDINYESLEKAQRGIYGNYSFRLETPLDVKDKYFLFKGNNTYEIMPEIRNRVHFSYLNLVEDTYPSLNSNTTNMDIILCRNVTIYFDRQTTKQIVGRFYNSLVDGGWLVVGHSEPMVSLYQQFKTHNFPNSVFYQKPLAYKLTTRSITSELKPIQFEEEATSPDKQYNEKVEPTIRSNPDVGKTLDQVHTLMLQGDTEKARIALKELLEKTPQNIDGLFLLAKLSADEGQDDGVHKILDIIDELNPLVPQAHYLRALLHQQSDAWEDAKAAMRRALYADRNFVLAHYYMGELQSMEGNMEQARRNWQNAANLLTNAEPDRLIPYGDGTTAGTLLHAIEQRLKQS